MGFRSHSWLGLVGVLLTFSACRTPTQITLVITTDLKCSALKGTSITVGPRGSVEGNNVNEYFTECNDATGRLGTTVLVPNDKKNAEVAIRIVTGVTTPVAQCKAPLYEGCIVARRIARFIPHTELTIRIPMEAACQDEACAPDSTCVQLGQCRSATISNPTTCEGSGCGKESLGPTTSNGGAGGSSGAGGMAGMGGNSGTSGMGGDSGMGGASGVGGSAGAGGGDAIRIQQLSTGQDHVCVITEDQKTKCWGSNNKGQLGLEDIVDRGDGPMEMGNQLPTIQLGTNRFAYQLAVGTEHTCALMDNNTSIGCWGSNEFGQIANQKMGDRGGKIGDMGDNLKPFTFSTTPLQIVQISAGSDHTCAILEATMTQAPTLKCWGKNDSGQLGIEKSINLGDGAVESPKVFPDVVLSSSEFTIVNVFVGYAHTCALLNNKNIKCWGKNNLGQLGLGDNVNHGDLPASMGDNLKLVNLGTGKTVKSLALGYNHTCAILEDDSVKCWGWGGFGQLGYGNMSTLGNAVADMGDALPPVNLGTGKTALAITAGQAHTCVLLNTNQVRCWGNNDYGQLGVGNKNNYGHTPETTGENIPTVDLGTGRTALAISAGADFNCALLDNNLVKCWGNNDRGQLGLGDTQNRGNDPDKMGDNLPYVDLGTH
jgi:alpha-tubulin suppressor-like RCC1 family protein